MLKKLTLALFCLFSSAALFASHVTGGELRYEFNGTNYTIYATVEVGCGGVLPPTSKMVTITSTCAGTMLLTLPLQYVDTVVDATCPYMSAGCSGGAPGFQRAHYSANVTLAPCADWHMSFYESMMSAIIDNIDQPQNQDLYMTATLNNTVAENNCPIVTNNQPFILGVNTYNTIPYPVIDADGDSAVVVLKHAETNTGTQMLYTTGYSASTQMGNSTVMNNANQTLSIDASIQSENYIYTETKNYRNGVLIGTNTKAWLTTVRPTTDPEVPMPATGTMFNYTACPGSTTSISLNFTDSIATDTVFFDFYPPTISGVTFTTTGTMTTGAGTGTITFSLPNNFNVNATPYFVIPVRVSDHHCPNQGFAYYNVFVDVIQCSSDSVWAGDANADFTADMNDPLAIAIAYGTIGNVRPGATTTWQAEFCTDWATQFNNGVNHKHADCNGDGTIDNTDLAAVTANYGQVHLKGGAHAKSAAVPDLYFDLTGLSFVPGSTVNVPLKLGTSTYPLSNVYGIATNIDLQGVTFATAPAFNTSTSWIATTANQLNFTHNASNNNIDFVQARKDHQNSNGQGTIATMSFSIPSGTPDGTPLIFHLSQARIVDNNGNDITAFNMIDDTAYITATATNAPISYTETALVVPNPSKNGAYVQLTSATEESAVMAVTDITGRVVYKHNHNLTKGTQKLALPTLAPGMYEVRLQNGTGYAVKTMKWVQL